MVRVLEEGFGVERGPRLRWRDAPRGASSRYIVLCVHFNKKSLPLIISHLHLSLQEDALSSIDVVPRGSKLAVWKWTTAPDSLCGRCERTILIPKRCAADVVMASWRGGV